MGKTITGSTPAPSFNPTPSPLSIGQTDNGFSRINGGYFGASLLYLGNGTQGDYFGALGLSYLLVNNAIDFGFFTQGPNHETIAFDGHSDPGLLFKGGDIYGMKLTGTALQIKSSTSIAWSNDAPYNATLDVGLCRLSAGVIGCSDGSAIGNNGGEFQVATLTSVRYLRILGGGHTNVYFDAGTGEGFKLSASFAFAWSSDAEANHAGDAGIFRLGPASLGIGTNVQGNTSGKLTLSKLKLTGLLAFVNNAAAIAGGLVAGDFYRTGLDPDVVCVVH